MNSLAPVDVKVASRAAELCIQGIFDEREKMKAAEILSIQTTGCFGWPRRYPLDYDKALAVWGSRGIGDIPDSEFYAWGDLEHAYQIRALCSVASGPFVYLDARDAAIVSDFWG